MGWLRLRGPAPMVARPRRGFRRTEVVHFVVNVRCLKHFARPQCLMAVQEPGSGRCLGLGLRDGELVLLISSGRNVILPTGLVLAEMAWHGVSVAFDPVRAVAQC